MIKKNLLLFWLLVALVILMKIACFSVGNTKWDGAVYVQMGKYIYSGGQVGLIEPFRPLVWPLILGALWYLKIDPIVGGFVVQNIFALGIVVLTYGIAKRIFDERTAIVAMVLTGLSPVIFYWSNSVLSDIPSVFFSLLAVFFLISQRYFFCAVAAVLAFETRFAHVLTLGLVGVVVLWETIHEKNLKTFMFWLAGLVAAVSPFVILNGILYHDLLLPFKESRGIYAQISPSLWNGFKACLHELFEKESPFLIFLPLSVYLVVKNKNANQILILFLIAGAFFMVVRMPTEISRYMIYVLAFVSIPIAQSLIYLFDTARQRSQILSIIFIISLIPLSFVQLQRIGAIAFLKSKPNPMAQYALHHLDQIKGKIWVTDPQALVATDLKSDELMYYPFFNPTRADALIANLTRADTIIYNGEALECLPPDEAACFEARRRLFEKIRGSFEVVYQTHGFSADQGWGILGK